MPYTAPTTRATGNLITAANWNTDLVNNILFLANPPACRVYHNTTQSLTTAVEASVAFNTERYDTDTMHDTVTNNNRITFNTAGLYVVTTTFYIVNNATGYRWAAIRLNGATYVVEQNQNAVNGDNTNFSLTTIYKFAVADWIEVRAYQQSGVALNVGSAVAFSPEFAATWVGLG